MRRTSWLLATLILCGLSACGDDPVSQSGPVVLSLKAKSEDVTSGAITDEKDITTESGNPFGAFIKDAEAKLGKTPTDIQLQKITLVLGGASKGVIKLEEVFADRVDLLFEMNDTKNSFVAGSFTKPTGSGPVQGSVSFDFAAMGQADRDKFLGGSFKAILRGDASSDFGAVDKAEAELELGLYFEAFDTGL